MSEPLPTFRDGRYVAVRILGEGSQATTFEGVDKREGRPVAIKRFRVRGAKSWKEVELAEREAKVLASLSHPLLPRYVEHFEEAGELFLVTEKIDGESLAALGARGGRIGEDEVVRFLRDASDALDHLHGRAPPVIHRDLKPSNVIRRPDGRFVLIDFGSVRARLEPKGGSTVVGTFGYMAPEQFQGRAMPASDVYGVGATALTLLAGREPEELPHKGLAIDVAAALSGRASPALVRVLTAMLDPDPDRRAPRIAPLLADLGAADDDDPASSSDRPRGKREKRRDARSTKRARKEAERAARRASRLSDRIEATGPRVGGIVLAMMLIGLAIARIAVLVSLRIVVPVILTTLSVVFGKDLRRAASRVSDAGDRAARAMRRARSHLSGDDTLRVESEPARVRVEDVPGEPGRRIPSDEADEESAEVEEEPRSERRRQVRPPR